MKQNDYYGSFGQPRPGDVALNGTKSEQTLLSGELIFLAVFALTLIAGAIYCGITYGVID